MFIFCGYGNMTTRLSAVSEDGQHGAMSLSAVLEDGQHGAMSLSAVSEDG